MTIFISSREKFHSNLAGLHVEAGNWPTDERIRMLTAALLPGSPGLEEAQSRAAGLLGEQVRAQAYTMAVADGFILIGWMVVVYLLLMLFLRPAKLSFKDIRSMQ
jgi:DHA2 family multidrug resistance protein